MRDGIHAHEGVLILVVECASVHRIFEACTCESESNDLGWLLRVAHHQMDVNSGARYRSHWTAGLLLVHQAELSRNELRELVSLAAQL